MNQDALITALKSYMRNIDANNLAGILKDSKPLHDAIAAGGKIDSALQYLGVTPEELAAKYGLYIKDAHFDAPFVDKLAEVQAFSGLDTPDTEVGWHTSCGMLDQLEDGIGVRQYDGRCPSLNRLQELLALTEPTASEKLELQQYAPYKDRVDALLQRYIDRNSGKRTVYENVVLSHDEFFYVFYARHFKIDAARRFTNVRGPLVYLVVLGLAFDDIDQGRDTLHYWAGVLGGLERPAASTLVSADAFARQYDVELTVPFDNVVAFVIDQLNAQYIFDLLDMPELSYKYSAAFERALAHLGSPAPSAIRSTFALYLDHTDPEDVDEVYRIPGHAAKAKLMNLLKE